VTSKPADPEFEALLKHLQETRGFDFTSYKRDTLMRRVKKRLAAVDVQSFADYLDYLEVHQDEFAELFDTILINVTGFFRDGPAWEYLNREIIPRILAAKANGALRVWCAGCASGEEAYSIAMLLAEALGPERFREHVKIYATDVDEDALATARLGIYTSRVMQPVPPDLREHYFEQVGDRFSFRKDLRRVIIFGRHDLLQDAPISRIDLLISRNTLMYLNADAQARILARFFYALNDGGFIFLGKAETLLSHPNLFSLVEPKFRIFAKPDSQIESREVLFAEPLAALRDTSDAGVQRDQVRELSFRMDPVAQILVDTSMRLMLANDRALELFGLTGRDLGKRLQDLDISYRPLELRPLITQVAAERMPMRLTDVAYPSQANVNHWLDVQLVPLRTVASELLGVKISFVEVTHVRQLALDLEQSKNDLESAYQAVQSSNEELETTNEELQSTVEELETTNEELQSTNEELETMNEELQSTNEELEAVNEEMRMRGTQLNDANAFLASILGSLRVAVIVVDNALIVKAWNVRASELWGVRSDEVEGTYLPNLDIGLRIDNLLKPLRDCLTSATEEFEQIYEATNRRGRSILCRVRLSPLKDGSNKIDGVVVLMEEPAGS
jgi:two-component system, chemotaxis family, CheB/CheR fusion protein